MIRHTSVTTLQRLASALLLVIIFGCASGAILPFVTAKNCCPLQGACCRTACAMKKRSARSCGAAPSRVALSIARWVALLDKAEDTVRFAVIGARGEAMQSSIADGFVRPPERPPRISPRPLA